VLLPIFGGYEMSGRFLAQWSLAMMLSPLVNLGMAKAFLRFAVDTSQKVLSSINLWLMLFHFLTSLCLIASFFQSTMEESGVSIIVLSIFIALRQGRLNMLGTILTKGKSFRFSSNHLVVSTLQFLTALLYIFYLKDINAWLLINVVILFFQHIFYFGNNDGISFKHLLKILQMLRFSWPYLVSSSIGVLSITFDKLYMLKFYPVHDLGVLGAIQSLAGAIAFIAAPLVVHFEPKCYTCEIKKIRKIVLRFILLGVVMSLGALILLLILSEFLFEELFSIDFDTVGLSFVLYCIVHVLNYPYLGLEFILSRSKMSSRVILPSLIMPVVVVLCGFVLIPIYGIFGAAVSMFLGAISQVVFSLIIMKSTLKKSFA
jgi:O-antigen/teichoic acid export membrane protein